MAQFVTDKDLYSTVFAELKHMGIKVPKVKKFKTNILKQEKVAQPSKSRIFGVNLADQEWIADCDYVLPKFVVSSITYLREHSSKVGLFRKAGSNARQRELRLKLEVGEDLYGSEPNDVASLLKQWLRELPEPLIPQYMHDLFIRCQQLENEENRINANLLTCLLLPPNHLHTLKYLLSFFADLAGNSDENMMGSYNLAMCIAPNIFVLNDSADKTSANLVLIHVSIIQLLIENATKIGSIPEFATFHHSIQEGRSCSELDSSGDFLDVVTSKRKKMKNGPVQDILSGIKKLVGQNSTGAPNPKTPEKYWNSHATTPRSASKREADTDVELPIKKHPKLSDQDNLLLNATPKDKGMINFGTVGRSAGHIRKKSFGLLRKKERKRQKSCHGNPLPVVTFNVIPPGNQSEETGKCNNLVKAGEENVPPILHSKSSKLDKSESFKKSASESYLTPKHGKHHRFSLSSPRSSGVKLEVPSYFLRHHKTNENMEYLVQQEPTHLEVKKKDNVCEAVELPKNLESQDIEVVVKPASEEKKSFDNCTKDNEITTDLKISAQSETPLCPKVQELKNGGACKRVSRKGSGVQRVGSRGLSDLTKRTSSRGTANLSKRASSSDLRPKYRKSPLKNSKSSKTDLRSVSDSQIKQSSNKLVKRSPKCDKSSQRGALSRNEAFIFKPKKPNSGGVRNEDSLQKSRSLESEVGDKNQLGKSGSKRASRNGSLIRGRPNTVNTGLRDELRGNESLLLTSESLEKRKSLKNNKQNEVEANESSNPIDTNKDNKRGNELVFAASESREKRKSVKTNKQNEVVEASVSSNSGEINKEYKRANEFISLASESREKRKSVKMNKQNEVIGTNGSSNPVEINKENKRANESIFAASGSRDKKRSVKMIKKNEVVEAIESSNSVEINKENKRESESVFAVSETRKKKISVKMNKKNEVVEPIESSNSVELNKENKRESESVFAVSETREKKRSVKMNKKNEVLKENETSNAIKTNKEIQTVNDAAVFSQSHEKQKSLRLHRKKSDVVEINESCIPMEIGDQKKDLDRTDTSLNMKFESFHLSSPINSKETLIDFINNIFSLDDKPSTFYKDKLSTQEQAETQNPSLSPNRMSTPHSIDKNRRASLQLKKISSPGSGSKIPRLRNSLKDKKTGSFSEITPEPKRKVSRSRGSDTSSISKIPIKIPDSSFDISSLQISLNDSCFKTPDNNFQVSNSINWVSGSKYLGIDSPEEDTYNKRESIALILRNNPGHVQAKVSMYDTRVRETVVCTRSIPAFSTPLENFDNGGEMKSSQRKHKKLHDSMSYDSAEMFNRKKNRMRSPLPPLPKFNITDTSTPSVPAPHIEIANNGNESQNSIKEISCKDENYFSKKPLGNISHQPKECTNPKSSLNESENSFNLSVRDENNVSKRSMDNVSHPLKEVTNISFETKSPLIKDGYNLIENALNSGKRQKKPKRSSFTVKSPHKRSKRVSRSESSPVRRRPFDKAHSCMKNSSSRSASIILERNNLK